MVLRSRRALVSVALGLVLGFTTASWLIAPRVAELSERRRGSSLCSYYGRLAAGPRAVAQQPLPQPQSRPRLELSPPPASHELPGPQRPEVAPGGPGFRSSPWQQPAPLPQRRRGHKPEGATALPGAPAAAKGELEEEDGGAAGSRKGGRPGSSHNGSGDGGAATPTSGPGDFLYVGVMTAQKYLGSRALAAQRTWARSIPGRVEFFSSEQSPSVALGQPPPPLPVIALPGVDDSYPPQKKSFMMIKYMHDHYLDKYEWFMRADDDVYIKGDLPVLAVPLPNHGWIPFSVVLIPSTASLWQPLLWASAAPSPLSLPLASSHRSCLLLLFCSLDLPHTCSALFTFLSLTVVPSFRLRSLFGR